MSEIIINNLIIYAEKCCDECNEIIHNHMDCPICDLKYSGTETYGGYVENDDRVICKNCGTEYKLLEGEWYSDNKVEVTYIQDIWRKKYKKNSMKC